MRVEALVAEVDVAKAINLLWKVFSLEGNEHVYMDALRTLYNAQEECHFLTSEDWLVKYSGEVTFARDILEARIQVPNKES